MCPIEPLILAEDIPAVVAAVQGAINNREPFKIEYRVHTKTGILRHFIERGRPVYATDDRCSHLDGVIFDVTDRKRAEEALLHSERRFRALTKHGAELIKASWTRREC